MTEEAAVDAAAEAAAAEDEAAILILKHHHPVLASLLGLILDRPRMKSQTMMEVIISLMQKTIEIVAEQRKSRRLTKPSCICSSLACHIEHGA